MADLTPNSPLPDALALPPSAVKFRGKRVTVMGLGDFGGGGGAVQFLVQRGAIVTLTDLRPAAELGKSLLQLEDFPPHELHLGGHFERDFTDPDLVVVNPAVSKTNPFLALAAKAGVPTTSEMNLFWEFNRGKTVGVTGSNGKSTTTAMTHALLNAAGRSCWLGGNIGGSLLPMVDQITPDDWVVLELSSFQLEDLNALQKSPDVSIVTNFTPNHLDRHGTLESYRHAKQAILRWQTPDQLAILNQDDPEVATWQSHARTLWFGLQDQGREGVFSTPGGTLARDLRNTPPEQTFPLQEWLTLPGTHNLQNALGASCCALALGVELEHVREGLRNYKALPHRLEFIAEVAGRRFFNDSLATTPESTEAALAAFSQPIVLLAGGYDKGIDLESMCRAIARKPVKSVALMGQTAARIQTLISRYDPERRIKFQLCSDFPEAFRWSCQESAAGDVILLSPGCASFDWFRNFADRGRQFQEMVRNQGESFFSASGGTLPHDAPQ